MPGGSTLKIEQSMHGEHHVVALAGELDLAGAPELTETVDALCAAGAREIELDLHELEFIDSSGIRSILQARESCAEHAVEFFLVPPAGGAMRIFELTGLIDVLPWRAAR
jgi:anti-sigma B factor antagonist